MKVSLITIKSPQNFGAALQGFATYKYLKDLGFDVQVINYYPEIITQSKSVIKQRLMKLLTIGKRTKISRFYQDNIIFTNNYYKNIEELKKNPPKSDVYIVGSDQVWNSDLFQGQLDSAFFLDFITEKKKISFASSMGKDDVNIEELNIMKEYLKDFHYISVREDSAKSLLVSVGINNVVTVLDPVFLLKKEEYKKFIEPVPYKNYLLIYSFEKSPMIEKLSQEIAKSKGLKIIEIGAFRSKYSNDKYLQNIGVEDFLSLINYADYIVTESFHGTAFSILLNKQFTTVIPITRGTRLQNIANIFNLNDRIISQNDDYNIERLLEAMNYNEINRLVDMNSEKSRDFIKKGINS